MEDLKTSMIVHAENERRTPGIELPLPEARMLGRLLDKLQPQLDTMANAALSIRAVSTDFEIPARGIDTAVARITRLTKNLQTAQKVEVYSKKPPESLSSFSFEVDETAPVLYPPLPEEATIQGPVYDALRYALADDLRNALSLARDADDTDIPSGIKGKLIYARANVLEGVRAMTTPLAVGVTLKKDDNGQITAEPIFPKEETTS